MRIKIYITPEGAFFQCPHCEYRMSDSRSHVLSVLANCHAYEVHKSTENTVQMKEVERVP